MGDWNLQWVLMGRSICVFCASSSAVAEVYVDVARRLGRRLAERGDRLVYGGGNIGLMGTLATACHERGGYIVGVIPESLKDKELAYEAADELIVTQDMRGRKTIMEKNADAFIALPGGFGTLEELLEIITLRQLHYHDKPVVILNTASPIRLSHQYRGGYALLCDIICNSTMIQILC